MFRRLLLLASALACVAPPALAATTPNSVVTPQTPNRGVVQFLQGTDTAGTYKTLYTAGANGSVCKGLVETNTEASTTHLVTVQVYDGSIGYALEAVTTVAGDGTATGVPAQNFFSQANLPGLPYDSDGNVFIFLKSGDSLRATFASAFVTSGAVINLVAPACADF